MRWGTGHIHTQLFLSPEQLAILKSNVPSYSLCNGVVSSLSSVVIFLSLWGMSSRLIIWEGKDKNIMIMRSSNWAGRDKQTAKLTYQMEIFFKLTIATLFLQSIHGLKSDGHLECSPNYHEIHLKSSSRNLNIVCNLTGCTQSNNLLIYFNFFYFSKESLQLLWSLGHW